MTLAQVPPRIDVHFVRSDGPWGVLGEPGVPPVAPALANALCAASGKRQRSLPLVARS
jgi:isoquinoline 1-oxidoreductase beta subunit